MIKKNLNLIIGIVAAVAAIIIAVVGSINDDTLSVVNKMEKAINKENTKTYLECFAPEERQFMEGLLSLDDILDENELEGKVTILQLDNQTIEDGERLSTFVITTNKQGDVESLDEENFDLVEVDGKYYFE